MEEKNINGLAHWGSYAQSKKDIRARVGLKIVKYKSNILGIQLVIKYLPDFLMQFY